MRPAEESPREREELSSIELREWYRTRFQPRLARAVGLGLVELERAAALENDLRALIGPDAAPDSRATAFPWP